MLTSITIDSALLQAAIALDSDIPIETIVDTALRDYIAQHQTQPINQSQTFGEAILAFRQKHHLDQLDLNPDEIWADIRDRDFTGREVSFE
jgi:hypothetical protein